MKTIYDSRYRRLVGRLKARRLALGLDQTALATRLGHTNRWLSKVEHLDIRLDVMVFIRVCRALRVSASGLIQQAEEEADDSDSSSYVLRWARLALAEPPAQWRRSLLEILVRLFVRHLTQRPVNIG